MDPQEILEAAPAPRDRILVQALADDARAPEIRGVRVSPNVYTTPAELDRFVAALARVTAG